MPNFQNNQQVYMLCIFFIFLSKSYAHVSIKQKNAESFSHMHYRSFGICTRTKKSFVIRLTSFFGIGQRLLESLRKKESQKLLYVGKEN